MQNLDKEKKSSFRPNSTPFLLNTLPSFSSLAFHTDQVTPGALFFAVAGTQAQGSTFIREAIQKGARGIVLPEGTAVECIDSTPGVIFFEARDVRLALARAVALFFPKSPACRAAITGTNGKTSIAHFTRQLWQACGYQAASLGTLGLCVPPDLMSKNPPVFPAGLSTPDPLFLHHCFEWLEEHQVTHCVLEASSHGLDQKRLHGTTFQVGVWTNLSRDHLDYHSSLETYGSAKSLLFEQLLESEGTAILHSGLAYKDDIETICHKHNIRTWTYGPKGNMLKLVKVAPFTHGQEIVVQIEEEEHTFFIPFCGTFQAENVLASIGIVYASGVPLPKIFDALGALTSVPGRLELAGTTKSRAAVYVDYAHTPHALETALENLRPHTSGKLYVVFGCGGNRDAGKREDMGQVAQELADEVIITDDNPRHENPEKIRAAILAHCPKASEEGNRAQAIVQTIESLRMGDVLLIAGKGHEKMQIYGDYSLPFDDVVVARSVLEK